MSDKQDEEKYVPTATDKAFAAAKKAEYEGKSEYQKKLFWWRMQVNCLNAEIGLCDLDEKEKQELIELRASILADPPVKGEGDA